MNPVNGLYEVAGLAVALDGAVASSFNLWPDSYRAFLREGEGEGAVARIRLGSADRHPADADFVPTYVAGSWQRGVVGGRTVYRFHAGENRAYLWAQADSDFGEIEVWPDRDGARNMPPLLHPVDRVLWMGILAHRAGMIVHSCGWRCGERALVFPGVSGAGKTTLCRQLMAAGRGAVLSDDRVALRETEGTFRAWGTPWPGDAKQARNESAALAGLCFIEKSEENRLVPIRPGEALRRLMEAASVPWYCPDLRDRVLPLVERLVAGVPSYRLGFRPEPSVVDALRPALDGAAE
jgi:hypothetical protein